MTTEDGSVRAPRSNSVRMQLTRTSLAKEELVFDRERAREILSTLYREFVASQFAIEKNAPQWVNRPPEMEFGSLEHRIWLFFAASTDLRSESDIVYAEHRRLWEGGHHGHLFEGESHRSTRELYTPEVLKWSDADFVHALARARFGNPRRNIAWWRIRAQTLFTEWGGDPFGMFRVRSVDDVMLLKKRAIDPLPGIGPKIASLIAIFFEELGLYHIVDAFPVDVHVQRFMLSQNIVRPIGRVAPVLNETLEALIRPELVRLCDEEGFSRITLSHAIWFLGNRACTRCWEISSIERACPVVASCGGAYSSRAYFSMGLWLLEEPRFRKGGAATLVPFHERPLFQAPGE